MLLTLLMALDFRLIALNKTMDSKAYFMAIDTVMAMSLLILLTSIRHSVLSFVALSWVVNVVIFLGGDRLSAWWKAAQSP